jgi:(p)ppGpp synthase/HD superfamily hydrolase
MTNATVLTDRFDRAILYATHVHGGQVRKGTPIPYIAHLLAVSATVLEYDGSEDMAIAALLHDAVEDQGGEARKNREVVEGEKHLNPGVSSMGDCRKCQTLLPPRQRGNSF